MIAPIYLSDEHTPQPIPPVNDDDDDDDDKSKPGSGGGNIDPDDDEGGSDDDDEDEDETLWSKRGLLAANEVRIIRLCYTDPSTALCGLGALYVGLPAAFRESSEWMAGGPIIGF